MHHDSPLHDGFLHRSIRPPQDIYHAGDRERLTLQSEPGDTSMARDRIVTRRGQIHRPPQIT